MTLNSKTQQVGPAPCPNAFFSEGGLLMIPLGLPEPVTIEDSPATDIFLVMINVEGQAVRASSREAVTEMVELLQATPVCAPDYAIEAARLAVARHIQDMVGKVGLQESDLALLVPSTAGQKVTP